MKKEIINYNNTVIYERASTHTQTHEKRKAFHNIRGVYIMQLSYLIVYSNQE